MEVREEQHTAAKKKLIQIFTHLQALNQLKHPVVKRVSEHLWSLGLADLPEDPHIACDFRDGVSPAERMDDPVPEVFLTVGRPDLTACPEPPDVLKGWLEPEWEQIHRLPRLIEAFERYVENEETKEYEPVQERFEQDEERVRSWEEWLKLREEWKRNEEPVRETMKLFEDLYTLHSRIERENDSVELMIADGLLHWKHETEGVHHPLLLQKAELIFNPDVPEFRLMPADSEAVFYSALLRDALEVNALSVKKCADELLEEPCSPIGYLSTNTYLKRVASHLTANVQFIPYGGGAARSVATDEPVYLQRSPMVFLRRRSAGFDQAIEEILKDLSDGDRLPQAVTRITGINMGTAPEGGSSVSFSNLDVNGESEDILFTKEANSEQLDIALKLRRFGSVLVQGPPGTGKTHTIANLLGHFLAEGKNVLVTSHTSRALSVLRDKVAAPLQNLCVSVLDEAGGQKQLEHSIDVITSKLSSISDEAMERDIQALTATRRSLLNHIRAINGDLRTSRENDYQPIILWGSEYDPSAAAKMISSGRETMGLIPGIVAAGVEFPLSPSQIEQLYRSSGEITAAEEAEFGFLKLRTEDLMTPEEFAGLAQEHKELATAEKEKHLLYWGTDRVPDKPTLLSAADDLRRAAAVISRDEEWKLELISSSANPAKLKDWEELISEVEEWLSLYRAARTANYQYGLERISVGELQPFMPVLVEVKAYLEGGGKLTSIQLLLKRQWKKAIELLFPGDKSFQGLDSAYLEAVLTVIRYQAQRTKAMTRWNRQITASGGYDLSSLDGEPEEFLEALLTEIRGLLAWQEDSFNPPLRILMNEGLLWEELLKAQPVPLAKHAEWIHLREIAERELPGVVSSYLNHHRWMDLSAQIIQLNKRIEACDNQRSAILDRIKEHVVQLDGQGYERAYRELQALWGKYELFRQRQELLQQLRTAAPDWAEAVRTRSGLHGKSLAPQDLASAWLLKQLDLELDRRAALSSEALQEQLAEARDRFKAVTLQLVENKAWLALARKTSLEQQSALHGWKLLMKKAGKRTGKSAPHLIAEARKLMPVCQTAVPVWIMPTYRVVDSFSPSVNHFDVVIVDEASQADIMALTALYLGKQIVVVGDDEQVSPEAVGQRLEETRRLMDTHLTGIPNAALYDGSTSIYDLAKTSFAGMTQLREHFRCVEPIIQFSNSLSYNGTILPLRDASGIASRPFTVEYRVEGGIREAKRNEEEARAVVSLLLAAAEREEYKEATFGVITLLGEEQAVWIDQYLQKHMPATEYKRRKIRCGNSAQFQGDERDVIFLTMVDSAEDSTPLRLLSDPGNRTKKRYNVAVSRARNQLWLVHSLDSSTQLKDGDLRKRLIEYVRNPYAAEEVLKRNEPLVESEFERQVMTRLLREGYNVTPQWKVGAYRIDIVVEGGGKRLAVECDGDKWHPIDKLGEDMARQAILERLGWTFVRIRGGEFFRDPESAMRPLFRKLEQLEIPRELDVQSPEIGAGEPGELALKERIINRAAQIRREWLNREEGAEAEQVHQAQETPSQAIAEPENAGPENAEQGSTDEETAAQDLIYREISAEPNLTDYWTEEMRAAAEERQMLIEREIEQAYREAAAGADWNIPAEPAGPADPSDEPEPDFKLTDYLDSHSLRYIDQRAEGGAIWVVGDLRAAPLLTVLNRRGIKFVYRERGKHFTKWQPVWFSDYRESADH